MSSQGSHLRWGLSYLSMFFFKALVHKVSKIIGWPWRGQSSCGFGSVDFLAIGHECLNDGIVEGNAHCCCLSVDDQSRNRSMDALFHVLSVVAPITWFEALEAMYRLVSLVIYGDLEDDLAGFRSVFDFGSSRNVIVCDFLASCDPFYVDCTIGVVSDGEICHSDLIFVYPQRYRLPINGKIGWILCFSGGMASDTAKGWLSIGIQHVKSQTIRKWLTLLLNYGLLLFLYLEYDQSHHRYALKPRPRRISWL